MDLKEKILNEIFKHYTHSTEFNGYPIRNIIPLFKIDKKETYEIISELINENKITLNFGDIHPNAHIKAYPGEHKDTQLKKLQIHSSDHICAYPAPEYLINILDPNINNEKPFTKELIFGEAQLSFRVFDLSILEFYRNDPRYSYFNDDISGSVSVRNKFYENNLMKESDKVLLESFGFAHDKEGNRYVAVLLRYLCRLSPEHQNIWNSKLLKGEFKLHPDYQNIIVGSWDRGMSVFEATLEEIHHINNICKLIGRPKFFNKEFMKENRPKEFGFLLRPTLKDYDNFILLLNKMIPDNINENFFQNEIKKEVETIRRDKKIIVNKKRSVKLLDEWLDKLFHKKSEKPHKDFIKDFKELNRYRQNPAHAIDEDEFEMKYFRDQTKLMESIYRGVQAVRIILSSHPKAKDYMIPNDLDERNIWKN